MVGRHSRRFGSGQETLPKVRKWSETLPKVQKWSETLPKVWKWSGDPPGSPEVVGRPSRRS